MGSRAGAQERSERERRGIGASPGPGAEEAVEDEAPAGRGEGTPGWIHADGRGAFDPEALVRQLAGRGLRP